MDLTEVIPNHKITTTHSETIQSLLGVAFTLVHLAWSRVRASPQPAASPTSPQPFHPNTLFGYLSAGTI
jgi:hypothetical protein